MVGPTDVVQPPVARAARARDAWLCHVSSVGGARRCGCAAAGAAGFFNGLLEIAAAEVPSAVEVAAAAEVPSAAEVAAVPEVATTEVSSAAEITVPTVLIAA